MPLKWLLMGCIFISCVMCARLLNASRARRSRTLGDMLSAMRVLRLRMLNSAENIGALLKKSDFQAFKLLGGDGIIDPNQNWQECREAYFSRGGPLDSLTDKDIAVLDDFFVRLGKSDREGQRLMFADAISLTEDAYMQAQQRFRDGARLNTALGALVGIGICVALI